MSIFWQEPPAPNGGVECRWGRQKSRFWYLASLRAVNAATGQVLSSIRRCQTTVPQVVTIIAGNKRQSLLIARDDDEMFMTRSLNVMPKTTEQHLTAHSDKFVAYVTNNKRLCSTFCTIEANYRQTRGIARPLCDSRATCSLCSTAGVLCFHLVLLSVPLSHYMSRANIDLTARRAGRASPLHTCCCGSMIAARSLVL